MSVGIVQKFSRVYSLTGPLAQLVQSCLFYGVCLIGCTSANVKSQPATPAQTPQANQANQAGQVGETFDASKQTHWDFFDVVGTRTPIAVSLPKAGNWEFDDQHTPWWVASNATLELKLEAKLWPERRQVTVQECLTDLGRWRSEARPGAHTNQVRTEATHVPQGFDSQLTVATGKVASSQSDAAAILLVGAEGVTVFCVRGDTLRPQSRYRKASSWPELPWSQKESFRKSDCAQSSNESSAKKAAPNPAAACVGSACPLRLAARLC